MRFFIIGFLILISGCATVSESNLYWGNYSYTLYEVKKNPGDESNLEHEEELRSIISKSKELNLKVPPGIYAELGMYHFNRNEDALAMNYFNLEKQEYPESSVLMDRLLQN